ncbi:MAG: DUF296 domain-containing protein [Cyanobacteriota bacterium]
MKYTQVQLGKTFIARFDDSEDLLEGLKEIIKKENIKAGMIHLLGAISKSKVVLGPEERSYPPVPHFWQFDDAREVFAMAIFAWEEDEPKIHLHSAIGHSSESKVGCIRELCKIYITTEVVIQEVIAPNISRKLDNRYNASLLSID